MSGSSQALSLDDEESRSPPAPESLASALAEAKTCLGLHEQETCTPRDRQFDHLGARFEVRFTEEGPARLRLSLQGELGRLPYSAENRLARRQVLPLLARLQAESKDGWSVSSSGVVRFACETIVEGDQAGRPPLETLALLMLSLSPQLEPLACLLHPLSENRPTKEAPEAVADAA